MRTIPLALTVLLLAAGTAHAQRIDGGFVVEGDEETIDSSAAVVINGTDFYVQGEVFGSGTEGDLVQIVYLAVTPNSGNADDKQGRVRQHEFSTLQFTIQSDVAERDLELEINPEKCAIDGKVNVPKARGSVTVSCSGDNIFAGISASQLASLQAAFANTKNVKIKVKSDGSKGSLRITLKGPAGEAA